MLSQRGSWAATVGEIISFGYLSVADGHLRKELILNPNPYRFTP
ncbi:hypothetical protein [Porphyromonas canoris]|nr:hypothetical protein [Porphyromonas canoris]